MRTISQRYARLHQAFIDVFDTKNLEELCFEAGVDSDRIPDAQAGRDLWAAAIIRYFDERGLLAHLVAVCAEKRPNVDWQAILHEIETRRTNAPCPYPGMVPFTETDSALFFGRDSEIESIIDHFRYQRFLLVIGSSGCGKSSLIRAGVLPRLNQADGHRDKPWLIRMMQPGAQPLRALDEVLPPAFARTSTTDEANASPQRLLLVVDQFESLFSLHSDEPAVRNCFIAAMKQLQARPDCAVLVVIRADFYDPLMRSPLWDCVEDRRKDISPLQGDALRVAIREPAESVDVTIEEALVERLVADADNQPVMPLIQETLRTLWSHRQNDLIRLQAYEAMGRDGRSGLLVALENVAIKAFNMLKTREQRDVARRILLDLVQLGEPGISPDTRRRQHLDELTVTWGNSADFQKALATLTEHRLITQDLNGSNLAVVDMSHEALITHWPRLRQWIEDSRARLRLWRQFKTDVRDWLEHGQEDGLLYRGIRLIEMLEYVKTSLQPLTDDEKRFLKKSKEAEARAERAQYRGQMAGTAIGAALGGGAFFTVRLLAQSNPAASDLAPLVFLIMLPAGASLGAVIGLGLWLGNRQALQQHIITLLFGAASGIVIHILFVSLTQIRGSSNGITLEHVLAGALLGVGLAAGISFARTRTSAFTLTIGLGMCAGVASAAVMGDSNIVADAVAGAMFGLLTALGYEATAARVAGTRATSPTADVNGDLQQAVRMVQDMQIQDIRMVGQQKKVKT